LADLIASFMDITSAEKQEILETVRSSAASNAFRIARLPLEVLRLSRKISDQTKETMDERQREFLLREQLKTIQKELGEGDDAKSQEVRDLADKIANAKMPEEIESHAKKELGRLERMPEASASIRWPAPNLEWLSNCRGRSIRQRDRCRRGAAHPRRGPLRVAQGQAPHSRIPRDPQAQPARPQPILCFVGRPGSAKTSLGQSIAAPPGANSSASASAATHDEAEIRGHRRTYIGALPGNVIQNLRRAGTRDLRDDAR